MYFCAPEKEMAEEDKILERCERLFLRYGIRSVTMDDVAHELGISKKTLYQYFSNKEDLVHRVTEYHFEQESRNAEKIRREAKNAIEEMFGIVRWMNEFSKDLHPGILYDLKKYHSESWQVFLDYRNNVIYACIRENVERGKKEGLYREELIADFIARMYIAKVEMFIDPEIFPPDKYPPQKTYSIFMDYHIRGIATARGIKYLAKNKTL